jgi:PadR family transcriptional regulator, regulatory protein PadR
MRELQGLLRPFLLLLIGERPGHGYDLIDRLQRLGMPDLEPGQVYRVLRGLERDQLLISTWQTAEAGPLRRRYELTAAGHADLKACTARLAGLNELVGTYLRRSTVAIDGPAGRRPDPYAATRR